MLGFILLKTLLKATSMCMESEEEQAVPRTKTGHVIYVTGEHHAFCVRVATLRSWTRLVSQALQKSQVILTLTPNKSDRVEG